jgi:hypothetical protein
MDRSIRAARTGLLRLLRSLLRLVMPDRSARRGTGDGMAAAHLMTGQGADRGALRRTSGLVLIGRQSGKGHACQQARQNDPSHLIVSVIEDARNVHGAQRLHPALSGMRVRHFASRLAGFRHTSIA